MIQTFLAGHRRRIRVQRALESAARGAFYASLAACACLAASKFLGEGFVVAAAACALAPLVLAARAGLRPFSIRDCAVHLDRALGLEERLATALEASGPMREAQEADALATLLRTPVPRWRLPREGRLLAGSLLVVLALLAVPSFERRTASADPVLRAVLEEEAARLAGLETLDAEFREVRELVEKGEVERALDRVRALEARLAEKLAEAGGGGAGTRKLLDEAGASAAALSAELARRGRTVHAAAPVVAEAKLRRQFAEAPAEFVAPAGEALPAAAAAVLAKKDWDPRYDPVIRRYFGSGR